MIANQDTTTPKNQRIHISKIPETSCRDPNWLRVRRGQFQDKLRGRKRINKTHLIFPDVIRKTLQSFFLFEQKANKGIQTIFTKIRTENINQPTVDFYQNSQQINEILGRTYTIFQFFNFRNFSPIIPIEKTQPMRNKNKKFLRQKNFI